VLGDRREARLDIARAGHDDGREPVGAPDAGGPAETAHDLVHRFDEMGLVEPLGDHAADPA